MTPFQILVLRALSLILWRLCARKPTPAEQRWFDKAGWPSDDEPSDGGGEP